MQDELGH